MIDIHNEAHLIWRDMDDDTKKEIKRQHSFGAKMDLNYGEEMGWEGVTHQEPIWAKYTAYRVRPGTEVLPAFMRPADEMDLTKLCKPFGLLHAETQAALHEWPHGRQWFDGSAWHQSSGFAAAGTYRAKPAPKPNLISRIVTGQPCQSDDFVEALIAAADLIATMSGGDAELRKAYDEAIK